MQSFLVRMTSSLIAVMCKCFSLFLRRDMTQCSESWTDPFTKTGWTGHDSCFSFLYFISEDDLKSWSTDNCSTQENLCSLRQEQTPGRRHAFLSYQRTTEKPITLRERPANINNHRATHFPPSLRLWFFFSLTQTQTVPEGKAEERGQTVPGGLGVPEAWAQAWDEGPHQQTAWPQSGNAVNVYTLTLPASSVTPSTRNNRSTTAKCIS